MYCVLLLRRKTIIDLKMVHFDLVSVSGIGGATTTPNDRNFHSGKSAKLQSLRVF